MYVNLGMFWNHVTSNFFNIYLNFMHPFFFSLPVLNILPLSFLSRLPAGKLLIRKVCISDIPLQKQIAKCQAS
jgi:hypothetical protein